MAQTVHLRRTEEELSRAGVEALADFVKEIGLPTAMRKLGMEESIDLKAIADSCSIVPGRIVSLL